MIKKKPLFQAGDKIAFDKCPPNVAYEIMQQIDDSVEECYENDILYLCKMSVKGIYHTKSPMTEKALKKGRKL